MRKTTKRDVIVATWVALNRPNVGAKELRAVQKELRQQFGEANVASPAAIARVLADEGAELCHPQIIELDATWRKSQIHKKAKKLSSLGRFAFDGALTLAEARAMLEELENLRARFASVEDTEALEELRLFAADARRQAETWAKDRTGEAGTRATQREILEWIKVWMQTPALFTDWVELRRRSADFRKKFLDEETSTG
ncbi:MAG TPA: hypothetical protein VNG71_06980 [Pyrinomonadaceae bacterium]|nr:hypothetical protein [Pyrinomonadaceae bacterium]